MDLIIAVLLFMGVITSPSQVNETNVDSYSTQVTEDNIEMYRQSQPTEEDYL